MRTLYLVRHAHADWTPYENRPLSSQGREDAIRVGDILSRYPIGIIYSSLARRAQQTISPLAERLGLSIKMEPDLQERKLGKGKFEDFFKAVEATWQEPSFAHPGGESSAEAQKRGVDAVRRLLERHPKEHIVLSTHGNLMALVLQYFDPSVNFLFWKSLTMPDIYGLNLEVGATTRYRLWKERL